MPWIEYAKSKSVAKVLLDTRSVQIRASQPFRFSSGIQSPIYCDHRRLLSFPDARRVIVDAFLELLSFKDVDAVVGTATAGIPWASFISYALDKPMSYVRAKPKEHGKGNQIEGELQAENRIALFEDLISTGGSVLDALDVLASHGCARVQIFAIFSYGFSEVEAKLKERRQKANVLTDLETLLAVGVDGKTIQPEERDEVIRWSKDPHHWKR